MVKVLKIEEWMSTPVHTVNKDASLREVVDYMAEHNIGVLPIVEDDKPVGIITERDILRRVTAKGITLEDHVAEDIMTRNPRTVKHDASILEVARLMSENNFRRLLVVKKGKLVGIVTAKDVIEVMSA